MSENEGAEAVAPDEEAETPADPDAELVARVEDAEPEELAREIAALRERAATAESELADAREERDELESKLKRKQADFQNFKKRMERKQEQEAARATEDLVTRLLEVRDNLVRALDQDEDVEIRDGIESTLGVFDRVLDDENVEVIEPQPGDEVDPQRHEVLVKVDSDEPEGTIADVHRPGYEMAEKVIRTAQVTVSNGSGE
ncbi:nucleotide exchange factor GrpE [Natronomonas sp. EA1]|uniref:nucleotide exchange factor GrpE n=1 Tax=Natronomonas sp. EA1 TaxID=3421655 RepID=UPI003EBDA5F3